MRGTKNTQTRLKPGRCCQTIGYRIYEAQGRKISKPVKNVALNIHSIILFIWLPNTILNFLSKAVCPSGKILSSLFSLKYPDKDKG